MRYILIASRAVIAAAVSVHLYLLTGAVRLADRRVATAMRDTDVAVVDVYTAKQLVKDAQADLSSRRAIERNTKTLANAVRSAAQAEAETLRRGVVIG